MDIIKNIILELQEVNAQIFVEGENLRIDSEKGVIDDKLKLLLRTHKVSLINYINQARNNSFGIIPEIISSQKSYVLSSAQRRLWVLSQLEEGNIAYNMPGVHIFEGSLDEEALSYAFNMLVARHESLRTVFREDEHGEVRQFIFPVSSLVFGISMLDLRDSADQEEEFRKLAQQDSLRAFDLSCGPLLRAGLYRLSEDKWGFVYVMHHIISDGWSMGILIKELLLFYNSCINNEAFSLPALRIQYKDYSSWQQEQLKGGLLQGHKDYWLAQFSGKLPVLELAGDRARPSIKTYNGGVVHQLIDGELLDGLRTLNQESGCTLFMGLLTAVKILLYRYTGQGDLIIGSPIAGRSHVDLEDQIGFYVNMVALRTRFSGEERYSELLNKVKEVTLSAYEHQLYPFDELVEDVHVSGDLSRHALFDVVVVLQNMERGVGSGSGSQSLGDIKSSGYHGLERVVSLFDLRFDFREVGDELQAIIEYNSDLYSRAYISRLGNNFEQLLKSIVSFGDVAINRLSYISPLEQDQLLFKDILPDYAGGKSLVDLFEETVLNSPDSVALVFDGCTLSYKELNERSNQVANFLILESGLKREESVGILLDRGIDLIVSIIGILKAGGMYVPMETDTPEDRLHFMASDAGMRVVITGKAFIEVLNRLQWSLDCLESYLCIDSVDVYLEAEVQENVMMNQELWDHVGEQATDQITGGGWSSSFTGEALSAQEMEEYAMNAYHKLSGGLHEDMRVLEIGCSSGLTLSKIAPKVQFYYGTDLSPRILANTRRMLSSEGLNNVKLACLVADEICQVEEQEFDLIIINSVIQHFHGHNYLRKVLVDAISLLKDQGEIFIGDVMDMARKGALVDDLEEFKSLHQDSGYVTKTDFSADLFVSRFFFEDLLVEALGIVGVEVSEKIYTIANELTKYRYDVVLKVDKSRVGVRDVKRHKQQFSNSVLTGHSLMNPGLDIGADNLAYTIYTSGTTGRPKGVTVEHGNVVSLLASTASLYNFASSDVWTMFHSPCFDFSVWEMYGSLLYGGKLVLVPKIIAQDASCYLELLEKEGVTVLNQTPSAFYQLIKHDLEHSSSGLMLRYVIFGGEALSPGKLGDWMRLHPSTRLINMYGITETTVHVTYKEITMEQVAANSSSIGKPIPSLSCYVLDEAQQLLPFGAPGELYISGLGLARGYLNRAELTLERFVDLDWITTGRLYRSGDKVRLMDNGELEYIGRVDDQVKIRGYRIELGEIQAVLERHEGVESAVVLSRSLSSPEKELVAYLVGRKELNISALRTYLGEILPAYMIPGHYVQLEALPLTANGKVDKKSLPDPEGHGMDIGTAYVAARNEIEEQLVEIWQDILGKEKIGVKDNFFDLGGHSLKATRLASQIHKVFDVKIALRELFTHTVLEEQALLLEASSRSLFQGIPLAPLQESYRLSSSQRRLWVLSQFDQANVAYNMPGVYVFEGILDRSGLEDAFSKLIGRHEILRTVFKENEEGDIRQFILGVDETGFHLSYEDLKENTDQEALVKGLVQQEINKAFDLSGGPLLRAGLYELSENKWVFVYVMHHIISDGWSMGVLIKELLAFYNAHVRGEEASLSPLGIQYKDYADWQQAELSGDSLQSHQDYWQGLFSGELPVLELAGDKGGRPAVKTYNGGIVQGRLSPALTAGLKQLIHEKESTLFMGLLALVNTLLYRYTGQQDIIIGSPVAGREHADLEGQIGFYINTLALRSSFKGEDSYDELLEYAKSLTLGAYEHQVYPFDALVDSLNLQRDMSRSALFDVMLILQNMDNDGGGPGMEGLSISGYSGGEIQSSKFDLCFSFSELGEELGLNLEYNSDIYSLEMAERLSLHLEQLLSAVISAPTVPINQLDYLNTSERDQLLVSFNDTEASYPDSRTIITLLEDRVLKIPNDIAVIFENKTLTYQELNDRSNQLANYLVNKGVVSETLVPICIERGIPMLIGLLGILKSGGAYVPLDPGYPQERISYMLENSKAKLVVSNNANKAKLQSVHIEVVDLDAEWKFIDHETKDPVTTCVLPKNLAYMIYTSGSTGKPKGVMIEHRNLMNFVSGMDKVIPLDAKDHLLSITSISFDISVLELFWTLCNGFLITIKREHGALNAFDRFLENADVRELEKKPEITSIQITPSYLNALIEDHDSQLFLKSLKHVIVGGERISSELLERLSLRTDATVYNMYGPTETTVWSTSKVLERGSGITIGRPIQNTRIYILDEQKKLCPVGVKGDLFIGGDGLARGYFNEPGLTAERFVQDPFSDAPSDRIYMTGDIAKWLPTGELLFIGRKDDQVKVNGYRIELGEIASVLEGHELVESAVVLSRSLGSSEKELVAYLVGSEELNIASLRSYLGEILPAYMIPGHYVQLEALPLTANGKVDRKSLPDPEGLGMNIGTAYVAARNKTEARLIEVWQEILGKEQIGAKDNFFDLGGHSLKATRLASQIHKVFNVKLGLKELFTHTVLEEQALLLEASSRSLFQGIPLTPLQESYRLSSSQRRLWVLSQFDQANVAYNMPGVYVFEGILDRSGLEDAFSKLIGRHEILRTVFKENEEGDIRQFILGSDETGFHLSYEDLKDSTDQEALVKGLVQQEINKAFDLSGGPLLRAGLYELSEDKWVFVYVMHHIISDGWSMGVLIKELLAFYNAHVREEEASLSPLGIQYKDYADWQQTELSGDSLQSHQDYWQGLFSGELPVLELAGDLGGRPAVKTYNGGIVQGRLSPALTAGLKQLVHEKESTLFMGLLALVNTLLYRYTGQQDIIIGSPVAGREHADLEGQIGFYINTLALRSRFKGEDSYDELLEYTKSLTLGAYEHQVYPFDALVDSLDLQRDMSRTALFDVMLVLQNMDNGDPGPGMEGLSISGYSEGEIQSSKFDLSFNFSELGGELGLNLEYNSDIYSREMAERLSLHLEQLLSAVISAPTVPINQLDYLNASEREQLLVGFNDTEISYAQDQTLVSLFEQQVVLNPAAVAVVFEDRSLSYAELNRLSSQLGNCLRNKYGVVPDDLIGIRLERSEWLIITILGVLKSGAAYVPVDPDYPQERIDYMLSDSNCKVLIDEAWLSLFRSESALYAEDSPVRLNKPTDLAYVIYTSGSTGRPKGVMVAHGGVVNRIEWMWQHYCFSQSDIILQKTTYTFDVSVWELFMPLSYGAKMVLCGKDDVKSPERILSLIVRERVSCLHFVPSMLNSFISSLPSGAAFRDGLRTLRLVVTSGEALSLKTVRDWYDRVDVPLHNLYGPTEASVDVTYYATSKEDQLIPIGSPIWNTQMYVINKSGGLQPVGVIGELCIGGTGLARGYLNQPGLSSEKFVPNPYRKGERMYKTGDLGRWLSDGNIEYIGRMDDQVKIRGYRIELGEIQNALEGHELVESAVVLSRSLGSSEKELVAYLVGSEELNIASLRSYLGEILPAYMIPGHYVQLEALPLTANGKVDRKSLPDPEGLGMNIGTAYVAARNKTEARLIEVWQEILGKEQIGAKDNFFDLGGHSLKATRLASQIHKVFNVKIGLKELFTHTVLEEQALLLEASSRSLFQGIPLTPLQESYRLSSSQRRLWVLSQFDQANVAYNMPGVYVFEGILDRSGLEDAFSKLIGRHEILRTVFKENEEGDIRQFILGSDETGFHLSYEDLKDSTDQEALVKGLVQQEINKAFDLSGGPLLRAGLYELSENKWVFVFVMHHIISDGWSMGVLIKELLAFYNAHVRGEEASLSPLGIQYKDYADWQQTELSGDSLQSHQDYWQGLFSGELPVLELAGDLGGRPAVKTYNGGIVQGRLSPALTAGLKQLVHEKESTLFMGLLALVNTLLYRYTGQQDIIIGSPVAGREHADLEGQIGFYINTLALRSRFNGEDSYDELLEYTKSLTLGAYEHQVYPFDALVDSLELQRDMSRTALFDVMLVLQNMDNDGGGPGMEGLNISGYSGGEIQSSKLDLSFNFSELGGELGLNLEYNSDIYSREMAERMSLHLEQLLSAVISAPTVPINQLDYLNASEREQLLVGFNDTEIPYAQDQTLVSLFEQQVVLNPAAVAVVFEDRSLSYAELNRLSSQLGNCLRNKYGVVPDDLIGIRLERSEWLIITILGVLKSGAAYVPVDPDYPQERIDYMLSDSNCKVLIDEAWLSLFRSESALYAEDSPVRLNKPTDLAYVIYTSGSTGRPKGVMVAHGGVVNRIEWMWQHYCFSQSDIILQKTTYTFDVSVWELFMPLSYGAKMVLCGKDDVKSPERILSLIVRERVSCLHFVPSMLNSFISSLPSGAAFREGLRTLRLVVTSGEALSLKTVRDWYDRVDVPLHNLYGPTEASVDVTYYATSKEDQLIPIGSPIWNTQMYVINKSGGLQPVGVIGELCIGGAGLAKGYLNQPGLSSEKFVPNPYRKGERMYKTGDLGRWLSDGNIEYIGRMDDQVKIRGYRIELGEIQNALEGHELVESAVVLSRSLGSLEKELVAYLVGSEGLNIASLRTYLSEILPAYMIPGHYVQLEALPLTANGKVDRKFLPDPEGLGMNIGTAYVAARNETEACLIGVWEEILGKEQIGAKDNFFDLGGHSLKATRLASQIHKVFNVKIGLKELFTHTVLEEQALLLEASSRSLFQGIPLTPLQESYRLSSSQRRLWVLSQFDQANVAYNMPGGYVFEGVLDRSGLEDAFLKLVSRHEILRTVFKENEEGDIRQFILGSDETGFHLSYEDLKDSTDQEALVKGLVQQEINKAFDLSGGPLLRAGLYELSENKWVFVFVMHHIISDGWSMGVLIKELLAFYNAHVRGEEASLSPLGLQYKDYADWQQTELSGDSLQSHQDYWQGLFSGELPVLELAGDKGGRPAVKTYNGGIVQGRLSPALTAGLKQLVHEKESTLFMGLLALVNTLLYRYTGQQDIIIGSPVAGREHADLEGQIGFYINTLALRSRFKGEDSYDELLEYTKSLTLGAYEHQVYPFDALVDSLELQRDMSRTALFDVMLVLQNMDNGNNGPGMEGLNISGYSEGEIQSSKFDMSFNFSELGGELGLNLEYNSDIYSREMAERLSLHLEQLLSAVIAAPSVPIRELDYLNVSEREQLLVSFNDTSVSYPVDQTLVSLFEQQVVLNRDAVAVVFEDRSLSYAELNRLSSQLGNCLRNKYGVVPDDLIGICLERSEWLIITILGVLKSGAAYVPVDPDYPQERIDYMLSDSNCKVLIDEAWLSLFRSESALYAEESPVRLNQPTDLAYVIYTSGSTGRPKGVMIEHGGVVNLILSQQDSFRINEEDNILQFSSISFDASVEQIFVALGSGACLTLIGKEELLDPDKMGSFILENGITHVHTVPDVLKRLRLQDYPSLRRVISGGERCPVELAVKWGEHYSFYNEYGPTETTITAIELLWDKDDKGSGSISIGRPVANTRVYIVSESYGLQGVGVIGEICIAGAGLARGYLNQAVLSSEKFVPNPYRKGERMYKTGDLGRWLSDGNIEYIGRVDDQVKIRGYRIEPGEIQAVLEGHEGVESAVVLSRSLSSSEKELVAYLVGSEELNIASLRTYLGGVLPAYMIPGHYVQLEALPLTTNGKVDKKSLPDPEGLGMDSGVAYVAPRNEVEARLVEVWQEILGKEKIGVKDNFFDLGGHSLKATRLASQIHKIFDVKLGLKELFTHTILEAQALLLGVSSRSLFQGIPLAPLQESYRLSSSQRRLWVLSQFDQANVAYNMPEAYVFEGILDRSGLELAFSKLISRHEILRTVFKEDGDIRQFILGVDETGFHLSYEDLKDNTDADSAVKTLVQQEINQAFDLSRGPLLRAGLYELSENKWVFVFVMHHIIGDGWSMGVLVKELLAFYNAHVRGEGALLSPLEIQYKDYADWQQAELSGDSLQSHQDYWQGLFSGELPVLELAGDLGGRPAVKTYNGGIVQRRLSPALTAGLKRLVHEKESTLFMGLLALVNTLLYRYTGQQDIIIGSPVAGREHADLEGQIGFYINTLALRSRFKGEDSYDELLKYTKSLTLGAYEHQVYPFDALVDSLDLQRDMSRTALFDVMLVLQNMDNGDTGLGMEGLSISNYSEGEVQSSKLDLSFNFSELGEELGLSLEYNSDIYSREMAERLSLHLEQLLSAVISSPSVPINQLDYLNASERDQLLVSFNDTSVSYPVDQTLVSLFEQQVVLNPDAVAVVFEDRSLNYAELNRLSSQLGNCLRNKYEVVPDDLIGICLERSEWLIITILGVLKSGAAYVPVDPDYPQERIDYMLSDSNCKVVIDEGWLSWFRSESTLYAEESPVRLNQPTDLAYVIYTSGSTGRPKGVMIGHESIVNTIYAQKKIFDVREGERCLQFSSSSFDASIWEIFIALISGGALYVVSEEVKKTPSLLEAYISENNIDIATIPPAYLKLLRTAHIRGLKKLITAGEAAVADKAASFNVYGTYYNAYGPTESSICATVFQVNPGAGLESANIPIGKPICNTQIYILDGMNNLLPVGAVGELCIGGAGLAKGYLNQPVLSSEKFVPNPYRIGERMYKTGDLGRWLSDGNIEYIGRVDDQVKIRGYRIELGEIQNALEGHELVESAVVLPRSLGSSEKELVAYLVGSEELNIAALRTYLGGILPVYMIPGHYVQLEALPLTTNGKVDKKSLPDPEGLGMASGTDYIGPRNETEARLVEAWQEILGKEKIGVKDNFFDLGGHSLAAMKLQSVLNRKYGFNVRIQDVFSQQTIEDMALNQSAKHDMVILNETRSGNKKNNIYFVPPIFGNAFLYKPLSKMLEDEFNCYGFHYRGLNMKESLYSSVEQIAREFSEEIIRNQAGEKEFIIFGYSMGAAIAFEMAKILEEKLNAPKLILVDRGSNVNVDDTLYNTADLQLDWLMEKYNSLVLNEIVDKLTLRRYLSNNIRILNKYKHQGKVRSEIIAFETTGNKVETNMNSWEKHAGSGVIVNYIRGDHWDALSDDNLSEFSKSIIGIFSNLKKLTD